VLRSNQGLINNGLSFSLV